MARDYRNSVKDYMKKYRQGLKSGDSKETFAPAPENAGNKYQARQAAMNAAKRGLSAIPEGFQGKFDRRMARLNKKLPQSQPATAVTKPGTGTGVPPTGGGGTPLPKGGSPTPGTGDGMHTTPAPIGGTGGSKSTKPFVTGGVHGLGTPPTPPYTTQRQMVKYQRDAKKQYNSDMIQKGQTAPTPKPKKPGSKAGKI
jgi:hypothetical protein